MTKRIIVLSAAYGDNLITLSTCQNSQADGRLVVAGKRAKAVSSGEEN